MLSVVVPTYRKKGRLRLMLASLISVSHESNSKVEIIIVDDGGEDNLEAVVEQAKARDRESDVRIVKGAHGGRSVARNLGAREASHARVLFLDDDVLVTSETLETHLGYARERRAEFVRGTILNFPWLIAFEDPESGALTERAALSLGLERGADAVGLRARTISLDENGKVGARLAARAKMSRFEKDLHEWLSARPLGMSGRWVGATGAHLSVDRFVMMQLGGFDEAMGLQWGAEDLEFGYRAEKAGVPILHAREAVVYHMDHDSCGREGEHQSAFSYFSRKH